MSKQNTVWLLTTIDNPFSPFTDFARWYQEDLRLGYNTCGMLSRLSNPADDFNDEDDYAVMVEFIARNWSGKHVLVTEELWEETIKNPVVNLNSVLL